MTLINKLLELEKEIDKVTDVNLKLRECLLDVRIAYNVKQLNKRLIIIGQEAICPDGLGRVIRHDYNSITVQCYIDDRSCSWAIHNVTLISPH